MPREFSRNQRLGNQVLRTLNELLRFETKDPRLDGVSFSSVDLSRDLSVARVYFSILDPKNGIDGYVHIGVSISCATKVRFYWKVAPPPGH